jgi:anti-anti-sigma factor
MGARSRSVSVDCGHLTATISRGPTLCRIELEGELDVDSVQRLERRLRFLPSVDIVFDLSRLEFIDSTGVCLLVMVARGAERNGAKAELAGCSPAVERTLGVVGLLNEWIPSAAGPRPDNVERPAEQ